MKSFGTAQITASRSVTWKTLTHLEFTLETPLSLHPLKLSPMRNTIYCERRRSKSCVTWASWENVTCNTHYNPTVSIIALSKSMLVSPDRQPSRQRQRDIP